MTQIIKAGDYGAMGAVRALPPSIPFPKKEDEERERFRKRIAILEEELRQRDETLSQLRGEVAEAFALGKSEGVVAGAEQAALRDGERLALLEAAIGHARTELTAHLSALERLAPLLAQDCLDILFGDPRYRSEWITRIIDKQLKAIERALVVELTLSQEDFPDADALRILVRDKGWDGVAVTARSDLAPGSCRLRLRLGENEIGIDQQWGVLRQTLEELSMPEATP